MTTYGW